MQARVQRPPPRAAGQTWSAYANADCFHLSGSAAIHERGQLLGRAVRERLGDKEQDAETLLLTRCPEW